MKRFAGFIETRSRLVLAVSAFIMIFSILGLARLEIDTRFDVFMPPKSSRLDALDAMAAEFGDTGQLITLVDVGVDGSGIDPLPEIIETLNSHDEIVGVTTSLPESVLSESAPNRVQSIEQIESTTGQSLLMQHDGTNFALITIRIGRDAESGSVVEHVVSTLDSASLTYILSGEPYLQAQVSNYILRIIFTIPPLAVILMLVVFRIRIGSFRATLLSMIPAIFGAVVTLGVLGWTIGTVSVASVIVPIFVIVLGSAAGLHITSHVTDSLNKGKSNRDSISTTLSAVGSPIALATITTMAGFLSLLLINSNAIRELGVLAAGGVLVAGIATWFVLPAVLTIVPLGVRTQNAGTGGVSRLLLRITGWPAILVAIAILISMAPGMRLLRANFSMIDMYKARTEVRASIDRTTQILGGSVPIYVRIAPESVADSGPGIIELHRRVIESGIAERGISISKIIASVYKNMLGREGYPSGAAIQRSIAAVIEKINPNMLEGLRSSAGAERAIFFLKDLDSETLAELVGIVADVGEEFDLLLEPVGSAFVIKEMNDQIIPQQAKSLLLACLLVFILTAATQRSVVLGLASTVPILVTLVAMFGIMGYARLELSIITGIMSGLTVGVGIDYAIHYVSLYRQAKTRGDDHPEETALAYVATPVTANALGLAIGFTAMFFSPLQIHNTFSILMWITMVVSSFLSLTFLPTLLSALRKRI